MLINISEYITNNSQEQRQSHIDLSSECFGYYLTKGGKTGRKAGDLASNRPSMIKAKENLLKFLNISDFSIRNIHTCHLCQNDSQSSNFVCVNPLHLYFGTASENKFDVDPQIRKEVASKAGKIAIQKMTKEQRSKGGKIAMQKVTKEDRIKGGKIGAKSQLQNGTHFSQTINICPHCNKSGKGGIMHRWHFSNCKHKQNK